MRSSLRIGVNPVTLRDMATVTRMDRGKLGKAKKVGAGAVRIDANITRVGVLEYREYDGKTRREYRPPEEVFHVDSLASADGVPVTINHPRVGLVTSKNASALQHGYVVDGTRGDEKTGLVVATLQLNTDDVQQGVEKGNLVECSMGYQCRLDWTPGVDPLSGEKYDCIQRDIRYNHTALGPKNWGRAGNEVGLRVDSNSGVIIAGRLDSRGDELLLPHEEDIIMKIIKIDGREFEYGSEAHVNYVEQQAQARVDEATVRVSVEAKRADSLQGEVDQLKKAAADFNDPAHLDSLVSERVRVIGVATKIIGESFKADGKSNAEIMVATIKATDSAFRSDDKSSDYLLGAFNALAGRIADPNDKTASTWGKAARQDNADAVDAAKKTREDGTSASVKTDARADFKARMANKWKGEDKK